MFFKIGVLKNFTNFRAKLESLFNKLTGLRTSKFIKKRHEHRCFPVKFAKFLRTPFFNRTPALAASMQRLDYPLIFLVWLL